MTAQSGCREAKVEEHNEEKAPKEMPGEGDLETWIFSG